MSSTLEFLIITFSLEILPGAAVLFILYQSILGNRYAFAGIGGLLTANLVWLSLIASGLGVVITQSPLIYEGLKWAGVLYLIYLGINMTRSGIEQAGSTNTDELSEHRMLNSYVKGLLVSLSNPKALIFFLALFPNFVRPTHFMADMLYYGALKMASLAIVLTVYIFFGRAILRFIQISKYGKYLPHTLGSGIIVIAALIALS